jgi:hypothetical protein
MPRPDQTWNPYINKDFEAVDWGKICCYGKLNKEKY